MENSDKQSKWEELVRTLGVEPTPEKDVPAPPKSTYVTSETASEPRRRKVVEAPPARRPAPRAGTIWLRTLASKSSRHLLSRRCPPQLHRKLRYRKRENCHPSANRNVSAATIVHRAGSDRRDVNNGTKSRAALPSHHVSNAKNLVGVRARSGPAPSHLPSWFRRLSRK